MLVVIVYRRQGRCRCFYIDHVIVQLYISKINVLIGSVVILKENSCFLLKGFGTIKRVFFSVISKLAYFAKLQWKHFWTSDESHLQQPDIAIGENHEEKDKSKWQDDNATYFFINLLCEQTPRVILI